MPDAPAAEKAAANRVRRPLGELVTEINTCLAIPDDAASMQQSSDGSGGANRVRVALPLLFDHLEADHGSARNVQTVVRMVHVCMDSFPTLFGPTSQAFCFQLMQRLLGLLTLQPPIEGAHPMVCDLLCSMTTMLARDQPDVYSLVLGGAMSLSSDCHQVLRLMCVPGALPAGTAAHVACFKVACITAAAADAAMNPAHVPPAANAAIPEPLPHCTVALRTVQHCEAALSAALTLVAHCAGKLPLVAPDAELQSALSLAMELMRFGHAELLQPAALAAAEALAPALPLHKLPAASLLQSVLATLNAAASSGALAGKAASSGDWRFRALRLLQLCMDALAASGGLAPAAPGLVHALCRASLAAAPASCLQAELVHLLADVVTVFPPLVESCGACLQLLPCASEVAAALVRLLQVAQLLDMPAERQPGTVDLAPQDDDAPQEGDSASARKRRRLRYNTARDAAEKAKQPAATQSVTADSAQLRPGFSAKLLQAMEALVPGQQGVWSNMQCLIAVQTVLDSCSTVAGAAWLPYLGRIVGRWAMWAGSHGTSPANQPAAWVAIGLLVAFAAACIRTSSAAPSESQQQALIGASTAFATAGLSTAQLETLLRLPWQQMQTGAEDASLTAAAVDSLCAAYAAAWLGGAGCMPSAALLRELLASAVRHTVAPLQAAAAQLAPAMLGAAAHASAAGLSQVSSQAKSEGRAEAYKLLASLHSSGSSGVRLAVALALRDCLYFDALCWPGLADICRTLSSAEAARRGHIGHSHRWTSASHVTIQNLVSSRVDFSRLKMYATPLLTNEAKPEVQAAMLGTLVHYFKAASAASLPAARELLLHCWDMAGRHGSTPVRPVLAASVHVLASPAVLAAAFGNATDAHDAATKCEKALIEKLQRMMEPSGSRYSESQEGLLKIIAALGATLTTPSTQMLLLGMLIARLGDGCSRMRATVASLLEGLAASKDMELHELVLGTPGLLAWLGQHFTSSSAILDPLADVLEMTVPQLVWKVLPAAIPDLMAAKDRTSLEALAKHAHLSFEDVITTFGHHALAKHLFEGKQDLNASVDIICQSMPNFKGYLQSCVHLVFADLLGSASDLPDWTESTAVPQAVQSRLFVVLQTLAHEVDPGSKVDVAQFLADRDIVTWVLKTYGDMLDRSRQADAPEEALLCKTLRSVMLLVCLIEQHIIRFLPQVMVLLTGAVGKGKPAALKLQALHGWAVLVQALLQHAPAQLANVMHQIVVTLLGPLHDGGSVATAAVRVVDAIVVHSGERFQVQLKRLPPLPTSLPALNAANAVLAKARGSLLAEDTVALLRDSLSSNSRSVREAALKELMTFLQKHRPWLHNLLSDSLGKGLEGSAVQTKQAALLSSTIAALLKCCDPEASSSDVAAQQPAQVCLGLLGAVDPARVSMPPPPISSLLPSDLALLVHIVERHLVRVLRVSAHLPQLDAAVYSVQELLRLYSSTEARRLSDGVMLNPPPGGAVHTPNPAESNPLFVALSKDTQALVRPYLESKFLLKGISSNRKSVVFGSSLATSFAKWLSMWLKQLTSSTTGSRLKIFEACIPILSHDTQTSQFLLPYVVQNVVCYGADEARQGVLNEVEAVLRGGQSSREGELCVQAVFTLLDMLRTWLTAQRGLAVSSGSTSTASGVTGDAAAAAAAAADPTVKHMADLLDSIPQELLACAATHCGAHARSLLHYETHVRAARGGGLNAAALRNFHYQDEEVIFLQEVYGKLEEPDGLSGLVQLRQGGATPADHMLAAQNAGAWSEALSLHEQELQHNGLEPPTASGSSRLSNGQRGYLRCLQHMGHLHSQLAHVNGWAAQAPDAAKCQLAAVGVAAAWRLGQWEVLPSYVERTKASYESLEPEDRWEVRMGRLLAGVAQRNAGTVAEQLAAARHEIMAPVSAAAVESYARAYPHLVRLHMLQEVADAAALLQEVPDAGAHEQERRLQWGARLAVTQAGLLARGPILSLRRQLAALVGATGDVGVAWLQQAKLCRAAGHFEAANTAALEAMAAGVPEAPLQHSKLLWAMDKPHRAIMEMQQIVEQHQAGSTSNEPAARLMGFATVEQRRKQHARAHMLLANWLAESGQGYHGDILNHYQAAVDITGDTEEKPHFYLANFMDQLMSDARRRQSSAKATEKGLDRMSGKARIDVGRDKPYIEWLPQVLTAYANSIRLGHRHIYKSLPRLLTLWYDFGTQATGKNHKQMQAVAEQVHTTIKMLSRLLPCYVWLVSLPQLCSRMTHPHPETNNVTRTIITRVFKEYPQQTLWQLAAVLKSQVPERKAAAVDVLQEAERKSKNAETKGLISGFSGLCDQLYKLCHHMPKDTSVKFTHFSIKREFSVLARMMPMRIMVPIQATLTPMLPPAPLKDSKHSPFAHDVQIQGIADHVDVMNSLQKPKKIKFLGSDGGEYLFLAKPKDDLRKDARMMEMMGVLNRLLARHPASRRRNLAIRRFAVTPLTEDCGILEWVPRTGTLRSAVQGIYQQEGFYDPRRTNTTIDGMYKQHEHKYQDKKRTELLDKVLGMLPPRLHRWFLARWAEPAAWHAARLAFTRTAAVMSMVGHICGLGDRHGENILMHSETGEVMHVDFGCLFDQGLTLAKPEMVPFRLTQNMVDAFGVSGQEGVFRRCCEITLEVLRADRETLLSVLETFVHDPLVDWTKTAHRTAADADNPHARDALATIAGRLTGTVIGVSSMPSPPLSVEGHAHRLIDEAVCKERLGKMYIWWMAWM